jgi:hypothetical protein
MDDPSLDEHFGSEDDDEAIAAQPSDRELLAIRQRASLPDIPGVSYRCPPAPDSVAES